MRQYFGLFIFLTIISGCSMVKKVAVRTTADVIAAGSDEVLREGNYYYFKQAMPGNLKLLEGLWYGDQENTTLLSLLIKGHGAYAFAVYETEALEQILMEEEDSFARDQAILHYEKAIFYGLKLLEVRGISFDEFHQKDFSLKLKKVFSRKIEKEDHIGIFYLAQSMGSSINLQRTNVSKMAKLNHVREMLKWVCKIDPTIENGNCGLFQSVIEASTPRILGGSQSTARKMFQDVMLKQPSNHMARLSYIQYHLIPMLEEDEFNSEVQTLEKKLSSWYAKIKDNERHREIKNPQFNLFNAVAKERLKKIKNVKKEIF